jgi:hypothetical protein
MTTGLDPLEPTDLDHRLRAAEAVVREAGRLAADYFARRELLRTCQEINAQSGG